MSTFINPNDCQFQNSLWIIMSHSAYLPFPVDIYIYIIWAWPTCMSPYDKLMPPMPMLPVPDHLSIVVSSGDVNIRLVGLLQSIPIYNKQQFITKHHTKSQCIKSQYSKANFAISMCVLNKLYCIWSESDFICIIKFRMLFYFIVS